MLDRIEEKIFLWNVFPLHPHSADDSFTNRQHNALERRAGELLLHSLCELLRPSRIVAIGNDAADVASEVCSGIEFVSVRHPSYGGQRQFVEQISDLHHMGRHSYQLF